MTSAARRDNPLFTLSLRHRARKQAIDLRVAAPEYRRADDENPGSAWFCSYSLHLDGIASDHEVGGASWLQAFLLAIYSLHEHIPLEDENDWLTPDGLPLWVIAPREIPIGWGYDFYCSAWKIVREKELELMSQIERK